MKNRQKSLKKRNNFANSRDSGSYPAYFVILLVISLFIGYLYLLHTENEKRNNIDGDFCLKRSTSEVTVILIDHTDTLNVIQRTSLETRLWDIAKSIPKNSLLKVYAVGRTANEPLKSVLEQCNPGDSKTVNDYTGNTVLAEKKYKEKFMVPIMASLKEIISEKSDSESPIMESLQSVSVTSFIGENNKNAKKKLILVSDLLQHSNGFSVYKGIPDFDSFKKTPYWRTIKSNFDDVEVYIYFLNRSNSASLQNTHLLKLWTEYFDNQNANFKKFVHVEG